jgi:hypothetical protein
VTTIVTAADIFIGLSGTQDWTWCLYSRKLDLMPEIVGGWVDNAWDIQRRRGYAATSRTTFS